MAQRLLACALAFVTLGAPVVGAMCEATCASLEMDAMAGHEHHHSCAQAVPSAGAGMNAVPHTCGHPSEETIATAQFQQELAPPAVIAVDASTIPESDTLARCVRVIRLDQSPPGLLARTAQLRV